MITNNHSHQDKALAHALLITVAPGEAISLPRNTPLRVRSVSGTAHITHTGRDLFLWQGDVEHLKRVAKIWGAPVLTALGNHPAMISIQNEDSATGRRW